jgi:hypothetical protein
MRRILAVATLGVALLTVAACADPEQPKPGSSEPAKSTLADKKKTCDDYKKVVDDFKTKMTPIIAQASAAQSDQSKAAQLITEFTSVLSTYQTDAGKIEAAAGDAEVKTAIKSEVDASKKAQSDLLASGGDPAKVQAILSTTAKPGDKVTALCSK